MNYKIVLDFFVLQYLTYKLIMVIHLMKDWVFKLKYFMLVMFLNFFIIIIVYHKLIKT